MLELNRTKGAQQMSNIHNDRILDEIRELGDVVDWHLELWTGTPWEERIANAYLKAIKTLDATEINEVLFDSSKEMHLLEYQPDDNQPYTHNGFNLDGMVF